MADNNSSGGLSLFPFADVPGLLTPEEQGNVKQNMMLSIAAGLLNASGYSPIPHSMLGDIGKGVSAGLQGYQQGMNSALTNENMRGQIQDRQLNRLQMIRWMQMFGALPKDADLSRLGVPPGLLNPSAAPSATGAPAPTPAPAGLLNPGGGSPAAPAPSITPSAGASNGGGAITAPAAPAAPNGAPQMQPAAPVSGVQSTIAQLPPGLREIVGAMGPQAGMKTLGDFVEKAALPTDKQKDRSAGIDTPQDQADVALAKGVAEAKGKSIGEIIENGGRNARERLNTLNVMDDALTRAGNNISTGPGAETWLKVKQAAENIFPGLDIKGLPETEVVSKLNALLASESAKAMSSRPTQMEFKTFMANNPGILTSVQGTHYLINVLKQTTQQDIGLRRLAMNDKNIPNWTDVEDRYYKDNPVKSPFTGKPVSGEERLNDIQTPPANANSAKMSAPSMTATNPKTGAKLRLIDGQWVAVPQVQQ